MLAMQNSLLVFLQEQLEVFISFGTDILLFQNFPCPTHPHIHSVQYIRKKGTFRSEDDLQADKFCLSCQVPLISD